MNKKNDHALSEKDFFCDSDGKKIASADIPLKYFFSHNEAPMWQVHYFKANDKVLHCFYKGSCRKVELKIMAPEATKAVGQLKLEGVDLAINIWDNKYSSTENIIEEYREMIEKDIREKIIQSKST